VLVGLDEPFTALLSALLVGGNVLVEGVPGTAKILMARCLAALIASDGDAFHRIQFTPDLMPSDILGTKAFHMQRATFEFRAGPIFTNIVVAGEVNRAPAKTQSALLEAMEERQVTVEGQRMSLPPVFLVVATQNPVEFEGTYPLPEAQFDRFLLKLVLEYASAEAKHGVLQRHHAGLVSAGLTPIVDIPAVLDLRNQVSMTKVDDSVAEYMVAIGRASRAMPEVQYGASVRGPIGLLHASKAAAAFVDRDYVRQTSKL
jgi:MoxR-like ATPase